MSKPARFSTWRAAPQAFGPQFIDPNCPVALQLAVLAASSSTTSPAALAPTLEGTGKIGIPAG